MFKPNELEAIPLELESQFKDLENRIMQDIVRRLKNNGNEIIRSADWQLHRLNELGKSKDEIKQFIFETLDLSEKEIERIYSDVLEQGYAHDERLYKSIGKNMIPFSENEQLQQLISVITEQTNDELKNITQSLGFAVKQPDGTLKFQPIADYYQKTLDGAMMDISSGAFDYNTVLKRIVSEMTNSGLRSVDYASGWSNRVPVAARRAVMTGLNQLTARVNDDNAQQLDTDMFEISWHSGYRPDHWWGGRWYTKEQLISVCGLGTGAGLCGWNCYHDYSPVIPGVSEPTYTQEQLDEMNAREQDKRSFYGKEYNVYEATQRQRKLETAMRAQRQKIKLLEDGGADEDDIITARAKYRGMSQEYTAFSKAMDLPQQRERITIDGLGNIGVGKWKLNIDLLPNYKNAIIPDAKITGYALNFDHPIGKHKAVAFEKYLGYNINNAEMLLYQIREGLKLNPSKRRKETKYGVPFEVRMKILGANGKFAYIKTGWIIDNGSNAPRLTSVYVDE